MTDKRIVGLGGKRNFFVVKPRGGQFFSFLSYLFVFYSFLIPGGCLFGFNFKLLLFSLLLFLLVFGNAIHVFHLRLLRAFYLYILGATFYLLLSCWISITNGFRLVDIFSEFKLLMSLLIIIPTIYWCYCNKLIDFRRMVKVALASTAIYSLLKLIFIALFFLGLISFENLDVIFKIYGRRPIISPILLPHLLRMNWSELDMSSLGILYLGLLFRRELKINKLFFFLVVLLISLSIFFSYSRLLWIGYGLILLSVPFTVRLTKKRLFFSIFLIVVLAGIGIVYKDSLSVLLHMVRYRFTKQYIKDADFHREKQIESLLSIWKENPIWGEGIGSYAPYIRNVKKPFSYEVWLVSYLMKTGLIGLIIFLIPVIGINWWMVMSKKKKLVQLLLFIDFLYFSSVTNQYISTSVSAVLISSYILAALHVLNKPGCSSKHERKG